MAELLRMLEQNKVMLAGRVTRDPELRYTAANQAVTSFNIASNKRYRDSQTGEWKDLTAFIPIVAWARQAERCAGKLKKGNAIFVEGRLQSRNWETKTGEKRYTLEVVADRVQFLTKSEAQDQSGIENGTITENDARSYNKEVTPNSSQKGVISEDLDEDIPF
ncbi:single-stranded DNA-binding protein [bacterium]